MMMNLMIIMMTMIMVIMTKIFQIKTISFAGSSYSAWGQLLWMQHGRSAAGLKIIMLIMSTMINDHDDQNLDRFDEINDHVYISVYRFAAKKMWSWFMWRTTWTWGRPPSSSGSTTTCPRSSSAYEAPYQWRFVTKYIGETFSHHDLSHDFPNIN